MFLSAHFVYTCLGTSTADGTPIAFSSNQTLESVKSSKGGCQWNMSTVSSAKGERVFRARHSHNNQVRGSLTHLIESGTDLAGN